MSLSSIGFNAATAERELSSFRAWLAPQKFFGETQVVAEIRARPHMACLMAYTILMPAPDLYEWEFWVKGMFKADFVVGNHSSRKFVLVEFEDGDINSLFKGGTKKYRYWSPRLEHGFGQIIDWAWAKHSHPHDVLYTSAFSGKVVDSCYVVVAGRSPAVASMEEQRFDFRRSIKLDFPQFRRG